MQRIGYGLHRQPLYSFGLRHGSTDSAHNNAKRAVRVPMTRLGNIVIPTPEEVRAKSKSAQTRKSSVPFSGFHEPDVSDLKDSLTNSLSAKLLRSLNNTPTTSALTDEEIATLADKRRLDRLAREKENAETLKGSPTNSLSAKLLRGLNNTPTKSALTDEEVATLTDKRRLDRLAREKENAEIHLSNYMPVTENADILRSQLDKSSAFMSPERPHTALLGRKTWVGSRRTTEKYRVSSGTDDAQEQRFGQRSWRSRSQATGTAGRKSGENGRQLENRRQPAAAMQAPIPSTFEAQVDESIFTNGGHNPEFNGPEALPSTLVDRFPSRLNNGAIVVAETGLTIQIPTSRVDSFAKGDYTPYLTIPAKDFGISPQSLGAVKVAARILTRQRQYSLPVRVRILDLVAKASKSPSNQAVKAP